MNKKPFFSITLYTLLLWIFTNFIFFNIGAFHFISQKKWKQAINNADLNILKNIKITPFANMLVVK
ncbi:hypothetical protein [Chryseobacterium sp. MYb328]|uniref:hypothetical protein n=1 Tax=Chryseobacterium sp. MYb328 TaxID=2745231 RepID=UPI0030B43D4E